MNKIITNLSVPQYLLIAFLIVINGPALAETKWCEAADPVNEMADVAFSKGQDENSLKCPKVVSASKYPETLYLPLPCGLYTTFKKIEIFGADVENSMSFKTVYPGMTSSVDALKNGRREEIITGTLISGDNTNGPREFFYVGKYELTNAQFGLYKKGLFDIGKAEFKEEGASKACLAYIRNIEVDGNAQRPAANMTWFSAVDYTKVYTEWLLRAGLKLVKEGGGPLLPWVKGSSAYLRLLTNAEWDYSARGSWATDINNENNIYPIKNKDGFLIEPTLEDVGAVADMSGLKSRIGLDVPNVHGLHGMMSGVGEMLFELYRFTRPDGREYGPPGGYMIRDIPSDFSGNRTNINSIIEKPFFSSSKASKASDVGFRIIISAPDEYTVGRAGTPGVGIDKGYLATLRKDWESQSKSVDTRLQKMQRAADEVLESSNADKNILRLRLKELSSESRRREAELNEESEKNVMQKVTGLVFLVKNIKMQGQTLFEHYEEAANLRKKAMTMKGITEKKRTEFLQSIYFSFSENYKDTFSMREFELDTYLKYYNNEIFQLSEESKVRGGKRLSLRIDEVVEKLAITGLQRSEAIAATLLIRKHIKLIGRKRLGGGKQTTGLFIRDLDPYRKRRDSTKDELIL